MSQGKIVTHDQLLAFLIEKYGEVEELPVWTLLSFGEPKLVPHKYRLKDGREISIDILFTGTGERILDPEFDIGALAD
tara:strand:+ start:850 stop:1083 length:234 start_codon:yes stop_codon:yes gene_type:complete